MDSQSASESATARAAVTVVPLMDRPCFWGAVCRPRFESADVFGLVNADRPDGGGEQFGQCSGMDIAAGIAGNGANMEYFRVPGRIHLRRGSYACVLQNLFGVLDPQLAGHALGCINTARKYEPRRDPRCALSTPECPRVSLRFLVEDREP